MSIDKDILILALGAIVAVLGYFIHTILERIEKVETRLNIALSTQLSHDKDIAQIKELLTELKTEFKEVSKLILKVIAQRNVEDEKKH